MRITSILCALICGALILSVLPSQPALAQDPCSGLVEPRLTVGETGRVTSAYGLSLKNQPAPGAAGSTEVALLPFGTAFTVLDGSRCNYGYRWWQIQAGGGTIGWAAEGDSSQYYAEPYAVGLHTYRAQADGAQLAQYWVTPDGSAQAQTVFNIPPLAATARDTWQVVELEALAGAWETISTTCPDRLKHTPWESAASADAILDAPLPALDYDFYPSPLGDALVLVRHLYHDLPRCETVIPQKIGISTVSILRASGEETLLFPFAQHASLPASQDRYALTHPDAPNVYLDEVVWSPQGRYIAFVAAYRDLCGGADCVRYHLYIWNVETGQLYIHGEARHVAWADGGEAINFFRLINEGDGRQAAHLYTMRPDGANRQEIWLPGGATYLTTNQTPLGLPWNAGGTRVLVENAGGQEVMLLNVADREFSARIDIPDMMPQPNRLAVHLLRGESMLLWTTIQGVFVTQDVRSGDWSRLTSQLASTGVPLVQVRPYPLGPRALIELADGSAYVLNAEADTLTPVRYP